MYLAIVSVTTLGFLVALAQADLQKITLMSRTKQSMSNRHRARTIASAPSTVPLDEFFLGTDLQWFGNISVGTPPQRQTVVFNTAGSVTRITSTLCGQSCNNQLKFDHSKSSTFKFNDPPDGGDTINFSFVTGPGVHPASTGPGVYPPEESDSIDALGGTDTVSVGGLTAVNTSLFLITNQTARYGDDPFSGYLGLTADNTQGFFAALIHQGLPSLFSLYLTPKSVDNAEITFGGIDESKFKGDPIYASLTPCKDLENYTGKWSLAPSGFFINGQATPLLNKDPTLPFLFYSSASNIVLSTDTANAIYAKISPDIKPYFNEPGAYGIPCDLIPSLSAQIDITFTSQEGTPFNLTIPSSEFNLGPFADDASTCQTIINAYDLYGLQIQILGGSLLKHYYTIWDVGGQRLGFAPVTSPS